MNSVGYRKAAKAIVNAANRLRSSCVEGSSVVTIAVRIGFVISPLSLMGVAPCT